MTWISNKQSGTKPNLIAKIWATNFGAFLWYMQCFKKYVQYGSNNIVLKYYGSVIPHDWDMSFEKFPGLPTVVAFFEEINFQGREKIFF